MMATRIIAPRVNEETKGVLGQYAAIDAIQSRNRLTGDVFAALKAALVTTGIVVESVQIENIDFSQEYEKAVEEAASAKARVETARNKLAEVEQLAQQQVTQAKAAAEATRTAADASAYAVRVAGEAEAASIAARGDALRRNPELVNLAAVEKWNGVTPVSMVPGSAVPFIGVK
jgi:regulator of protease activity HflC (stomatin/prohibitin superfamily)